MDTSLIATFLSAQTGMMQLAFAARFAGTNADTASSVTKLIDAAQQNFNSLANVAAGIGTTLNVSA